MTRRDHSPPRRHYYESRDIRADSLTPTDVVRHEGQWRTVDTVFRHSDYEDAEEYGDLDDTGKALLVAYLDSDDYVVARLRIEFPGLVNPPRMLVPFRRYELVTVQAVAGTTPT